MNCHDKATKVYNSFSPFIREFIYHRDWKTMHEVQIEAADAIFHSNNNVLICSSTASGKTEAAFFPILSILHDCPPSSVGALYIAPLKALINDQFDRLDLLMEQSNISVFHWHGDVPSSQKNKFLKKPSSVLQITPESLESILLNRKDDIPAIFGDLQFVIIDEVHTFMGCDRGSQICCLIERISRLIQKNPRRIGLSATIGDTDSAAQWLSGNAGRECRVVNIQASKAKWNLALQHFFVQPQNVNSPVQSIDQAQEFIYNCSRQKKTLIFSNSRQETELITTNLKQIAKKLRQDDIFYIHHGNLSATLREQAEEAIKDDSKKTVTCATTTLELGVDVGRLERIINISSPCSVSSFLQRIGRSGRRGIPPEMIMVFREQTPSPDAPIYELIPWDFIQGIAIIQLYIQERWLEPAEKKVLPFSLLYHQTMSILASQGELTPSQLAKNVLSLSAFKDISKEDFRELLIHLIKTEHLQQTEQKSLIIGLKGEKIVNNFKFFAVFNDSEDFEVRCKAEKIGTITTPPPAGDKFALAGSLWEIEELDLQHRVVYVKAVKGTMESSWASFKGDIHTKILQSMKKVLSEDTVYQYLTPQAVSRLKQARDDANNSGILKNGIVYLGGSRYCLFPWLGSSAVRTLKRFIQYRCASDLNITSIESNSYYIIFKMHNHNSKDFIDFFTTFLSQQNINPAELVDQNELLIFEKFDRYIPRPLLQKAYYTDRLTSQGIIEYIKNLKNENEIEQN